MSNWLENTPYQLLGISPIASKKEIQAAYDKARRAEKETRRQRELSDARDQLTRVEKRLAVDAFVFPVKNTVDEDALIKEITPLTDREPDWLSLIDVQAIVRHDAAQLIALIIENSVSTTQHSSRDMKPLDHYSGIEQFEKDLDL